MKRSTKAAFWILIYLAIICMPLIFLFIGPRPAGREFWRELSVALGYAGLALMGLQFIPTARLPILGSVFPMDALYKFHHLSSIMSFLFILAHPLLLFANNRYTLQLLNIFTAPWRARAAVVSLTLLIIVIITSIWREDLKLNYERWHIIHDIAVMLATILALYHIFKVNYHTSTPLQTGLWILYAATWAYMFSYTRLIKPAKLMKKPYRLLSVQPERGNAWTVELEPIGHEGLAFKAGQIAWIMVNSSPLSIHEHPFSFASSAEHPKRFQFTIRNLGDFTSTIGDLEPGITVYVDGPYGTFDLNHQDQSGLALIAGGIGAAPVMSMLRTLADRNDQRPILFIYGNYSWEDTTFREQLAELEKQLDLTMVYVLERPTEDWAGETGYVTREMLDRYLPADRKEWRYFVCGPQPMMVAVQRFLDELDIPLRNIHIEDYKMA